MNEKKILVIITPGFAKDESDTTCLPMQQSFILTLNKNFPNLKILVFALHYPYIKKTYQWFGNTVISFNGKNKGGLRKMFLLAKCSRAMKSIQKSNNIAGVLSFWYTETALLGRRFSNRFNLKHYCWMWGQDARKNNKYASLGFMKADELIAFSDFINNEFEKNYGIRPHHVITPGVDVNEFSSNNVERNIDIIGVGSLISLKQYDVFVEVIGAIKEMFPHIKAVLIGDGPEKKMVQDLIQSSGLQSNITLAGELAHPEVLQLMQSAKVFLHTSSYEGFGIVCIEALCAGAKVISFVKPMNIEIENWHIATNKEKMIEKTLDILKDPNIDYKRIVPYSIESTVEKMAELFSF